MQLENSFTVPLPVDEAWRVLMDIDRIAPCMPGAVLDSVEGDDFTGVDLHVDTMQGGRLAVANMQFFDFERFLCACRCHAAAFPR